MCGEHLNTPVSGAFPQVAPFEWATPQPGLHRMIYFERDNMSLRYCMQPAARPPVIHYVSRLRNNNDYRLYSGLHLHLPWNYCALTLWSCILRLHISMGWWHDILAFSAASLRKKWGASMYTSLFKPLNNCALFLRLRGKVTGTKLSDS